MVIKWKQKTVSLFWDDIIVLSAWLYGGLLYFVNVAINLLTGSQMIADGVMYAYFGLLIVMSYKNWGRKLRFADIIFVFFVVFIVLFSYILNEPNRLFIEAQLPELFFNVLPFYFLGLMIKQDSRTFDMLYYGSAVAVLINCLYVAVILGTGRQMQTDNLFIAYSVLPHTLMMLWYAMEKNRPANWFMAITGLIFILSMGSRGPVLSCVVFVTLYLVYSSRKSVIRTIFFVVLPASVIIYIVLSGAWESILLWIRGVIVQFNLSTRVIDAVLFGAANGSNNERMRIYEIMLGYIKQRPFTGYGIYGEWSMIGYTAHQMVLELWCHYGVIIGSILALTGMGLIFKAFRKNINSHSQVFILLMCSFGLVRGIYAGSYISDYIFLLLGISVAAVRIPKTQIKNREV